MYTDNAETLLLHPLRLHFCFFLQDLFRILVYTEAPHQGLCVRVCVCVCVCGCVCVCVCVYTKYHDQRGRSGADGGQLYYTPPHVCNIPLLVRSARHCVCFCYFVFSDFTTHHHTFAMPLFVYAQRHTVCVCVCVVYI